MGTSLMSTLRWLRVPGDTVFAIGAIAFVLFIFGLRFGYFVKPGRNVPEAEVSDGTLAA
jgi:nitric oxide reductase subunit B